MVTLEPVHEYIRKRKLEWGRIRDAFITQTDKDEDYYYQDVEGTRTNYTQKQYDNIVANTDIPVSIDYTYSLTNDKLALLTNHDPSHKVISTGMNDKTAETIAMRLDEMKHSIMRDSRGSLENEEVIKTYLIRGLGIGGLKRPEFYHEGEIPLRYCNIHPAEIILDPNCKSLDCQDMEGYFLQSVCTKQRALQFYTPLINLINEKAKAGRIPGIDGNVTVDYFIKRSAAPTSGVLGLQANFDEGSLEITEFVDKVYATLLVVQGEGGKLEYIFRENFDYPEQEIALINNVLAEVPGLYVRSTLMLGDYTVLQEINPFTLYELAILSFERRGRQGFYKSYGLVHFIRTMQDAFDKTISTMILNGMLINNAGYKAPVNSIKNEEDWKTYGDPRIIKYYQPQVFEGKVFVPEREEVGQLSPYFPMMLQVLERAMKAITGLTDVIQGDPNVKIEVFSTLQQYQDSAMERIRRDAKRINIFSTDVGAIVIEQLIMTIEPDILYSFENNSTFGSVKFSKEAVNLIKQARFRVIPIPIDALPTQKLSIAKELMRVAQTSEPGSVERKVFTQGSLKLAGIRTIDDLLEQIDVVKSMQGQLQQAQEMLDRDKELMKQYENRAINAEHDVKVMRLMVNSALKIAEAKGEANATIATAEEMEKLKAQLKVKSENNS